MFQFPVIFPSQDAEDKESSLLKLREKEEKFLVGTTEKIANEVAAVDKSFRFALDQHEYFNNFYEDRKRKRESSASSGPSIPPS